MAIDAVNNSNVTRETAYLHPNISSTISANELEFQTTAGNLKMFAAYTSDKGEDNKVIKYSSADEFIFKNGEPNLKKYGQSAYNIINWLNSQGEVYGIRLMPDNAGYSHAFLNILTRKESKKVKDKNGALVNYDNIILKPAIAYSNSNNTSKELLDYELNKDRSEETIDGFVNHLLFTVFPTGRGKSYNDLGFRVSINTSYDSMYDFRVYNFEIIRYDQNDNANIIEGPFYVSFSSDALSNSGESMFIEDVINKYSRHLRCIFNEDNFDKVCELINPYCDPHLIDVLTGVTRSPMNKLDVFFSTVTQQFEDVHISLQRYSSGGTVINTADGIPQINIVDTTDLIEQTILLVDNDYRQATYNRYTENIDYMKDVFNSVTNGKYHQMVDDIMKVVDGNNIEDGCYVQIGVNQLNNYYNDIQNLIDIFNTSKLDSDFNKISDANVLVENFLKEFMDKISELVSYQKAIQIDSNILNIDSLVNSIYGRLNSKQVIDIKSIDKKCNIDLVSNDLLILKADTDMANQIEQLNVILTDVSSIVNYFGLVIADNNLASGDIIAITNLFNNIVDKYNSLFDSYLADANRKKILVSIFTSLDTLLHDLYNCSRIVIVNVDLIILTKLITERVTELVASLVPVVYNNNKLYDVKVSTDDGINDLIATIKTNIDNSTVTLSTMKSIVYINQLQDFNSPCRLTNGNDGDLDDSIYSVSEIKNAEKKLLIKAFKGLIDDSITDRKITPFRFILDANYNVDVKNAIVTLVRDIRKDVFAYIDTNFCASPSDAIIFRNSSFPVSSQKVAIYTQDLTFYDEFTGKDIRLTPTYVLASKIPTCSLDYGLQYPIAGNRRGTIDGFKNISFIPNKAYKEELYTHQINYIESDTKRTRFGSQLTSDMKTTPLSNINNVLTALQIQVDIEDMAEDYQFEFNDEETLTAFQYAVTEYLDRYITNRACDEVSASVYASDYDKQQKIVRVNAKIKFKDIIERVIITIEVVK